MIWFISLLSIAIIGSLGTRLAHYLIKQSAAKFLHPKRNLASSSPSDYGIETWEDVSFKSADGLTLGGWFIAASDPSKATIIFVHGIRGNRSSLLAQASQLIQQGFGALLIDLRNHGASEGDLTTMSVQEIFDVEGAVRCLKNREDVNETNIGIMGHSLGAATAIRAAARQTELKFVIAQASFADLRSSMHQAARALSGIAANNRLASMLLHPFVCLMIRYAQKQVGEKADNISPKRDLMNLTDKPCLFIHGLKDKTIAPSNSQMLFKHAKGEKELLLLKNTGHSSSSAHDNDLLTSTLIQFAETHGSQALSYFAGSELSYPVTPSLSQRQASLSA